MSCQKGSGNRLLLATGNFLAGNSFKDHHHGITH